MFLNLQTKNFATEIAPFIKSGIIIDTSVFKIIVDGVVKTKFTKQRSEEFESLLLFLDLIKMNNRWDKFFITPLLKAMEEKNIKKDSILSYIDLKIPVVEIGDISICLTANDFVSKAEKAAILSSDHGLNQKYQDSKNIMVMDYKSSFYNYS